MPVLDVFFSPCEDSRTSPRLENAEKVKPEFEAPRSMGNCHGHLGLHRCPWMDGGGGSADVLRSHSLLPAAVSQCIVNEAIVPINLLRDSIPCSISKNMSGSSKQVGGLVSRLLTCIRHQWQCLYRSFQSSVLLYAGMLVERSLCIHYMKNHMVSQESHEHSSVQTQTCWNVAGNFTFYFWNSKIWVSSVNSEDDSSLS